MNHQNYARYLTMYSMFMLNLADSHPEAYALLKKSGFSVARSSIPGCRVPVDMTIEQTMNRHAKTKGGLIGFSMNKSAYYRWCVTKHTKAKYVEATLDIAGLNNNEFSKHKTARPVEIKRSENEVENVMKAFNNFCNPFDEEFSQGLYCLSSGSRIPPDVETDLLNVEQFGKNARDEFINDRLVEKKKSFHDPIHKSKLKTFTTQHATKKLTTSSKK